MDNSEPGGSPLKTELIPAEALPSMAAETVVDITASVQIQSDDLAIPLAAISVLEPTTRKSRRSKSDVTSEAPIAQAVGSLSHAAWALLSGAHAANLDAKLARQLGKLAILASRLRGVEAAYSSEACAQISKLCRLLAEIQAAEDFGHRKQVR